MRSAKRNNSGTRRFIPKLSGKAQRILPRKSALGAGGEKARAEPYFRGISHHVIAMDGYRFGGH